MHDMDISGMDARSICAKRRAGYRFRRDTAELRDMLPQALRVCCGEHYSGPQHSDSERAWVQ